MSLNTTPRTWVTGEVVTAAEMNAEIRDAIAGLQSAWTAWTPTLTGITIGNGVLSCAYQRSGKWITARFLFTAGSTTTYSATVLAATLPVTPHSVYTTNTNFPVGAALIQPGIQSTRIPGIACISSTGTLFWFADTGSANAAVTNLVPGTFGTSGIISATVTYEAA